MYRFLAQLQFILFIFSIIQLAISKLLKTPAGVSRLYVPLLLGGFDNYSRNDCDLKTKVPLFLVKVHVLDLLVLPGPFSIRVKFLRFAPWSFGSHVCYVLPRPP